MNKIHLILYFCLGILLCSCRDNNTGERVLFQTDSYTVSSEDNFILPSYNLSVSVLQGGHQGVMAYNYKTGDIDLFSDDSIWGTISLQKDGPNAVPGELVSLLPVFSDSIWVFNRESFYLIDKAGNVMAKHSPEYPVICECNYAMNTAVAGWNPNGILSYPVKDGNTYKLISYDVKSDQVVRTYELLYPESRTEDKFYGYLELPNVSFQKDKAIYNFSYDCTVFVLDLQSGETEKHTLPSKFAPQALPTLERSSDPTTWLQYGWENPHYYMVYYLSGPDVYIRPMLKGIDISNRQNSDTIIDEKQLVLAVIDSDFKLLDEIELPKETYCNFHGWCSLPDGFLLYKDNALGKPHDDLMYDVIRIR